MTKIGSFAIFFHCTFIFFAISACESSNKSQIFVEEGDMFFDDAFKRLSKNEKKGLGTENPSQINGFFFQGIHESCVVLFPKNEKIVIHTSNPAFCYEIESNKFTRRI